MSIIWIANIDRSKARQTRANLEIGNIHSILIGKPCATKEPYTYFSVEDLEVDFNMVGLYREVPDNKSTGSEHGPFE